MRNLPAIKRRVSLRARLFFVEEEEEEEEEEEREVTRLKIS